MASVFESSMNSTHGALSGADLPRLLPTTLMEHWWVYLIEKVFGSNEYLFSVVATILIHEVAYFGFSIPYLIADFVPSLQKYKLQPVIKGRRNTIHTTLFPLLPLLFFFFTPKITFSLRKEIIPSHFVAFLNISPSYYYYYFFIRSDSFFLFTTFFFPRLFCSYMTQTVKPKHLESSVEMSQANFR